MIDPTDQKNYSFRWRGAQRRIGITGGIASGKSSVGAFLRNCRNWPILDADQLARDALAPHSKASKQILKKYKEKVSSETLIKESSQIDRAKLGRIIFDSKKDRIWVESLLHPIIVNKLKGQLKMHENLPVIVLIIPLLFEANLNDLCSEVWLVECDPEQQYERLMNRDGLSREDSKKRIEAQIPISIKKKFADYIIDNTHAPGSWEKQLMEIV